MSDILEPRIALVGDRYNHDEPSHPRIESLLPDLGYVIKWVPTTSITEDTDFADYDAIWVVPGGPYRAQQGVHRAIRFARTRGVPFLGTCGGFFGAILEYAQNVLLLPEVAELGDVLDPIDSLIVHQSCVPRGDHRIDLTVEAGSRLSAIYGNTQASEAQHCDDRFVPEFMHAAEAGELRFIAHDPAGHARALEITNHPFFLGCLFQPELSSSLKSVHPILAAFLDHARYHASRAPKQEGR